MNYNKKTVYDVDVNGKKVLLRCDFNVPQNKETGEITSDKRIVAAIPTIKYLLENGAAVIACSHLGKPKGEWKTKLTLAPVAKRLSELLGQEVIFASDIIGEDAQAKAAALKPGQIMLLENLRFDIREEKNGADFAKALANMADIFVSDAFGTVHRAHASTAGVAAYLPAYSGLLVDKELSIMGILRDMLSKVFMSKERRQQQVQTSLIEEFRYPKYGPGQLWETAAQEIEKLGGKVVKGCEVLGARTENGKVVSLRVRDGQGEHDMEGDVFFSSMPLKDLVAGMNDVPADVQEIAAGLPYRDFVTVGLLVDRLNLKNETKLKTLGNIVPDCWIYVQDADVKLGRIQIFNNWSPYLVKDPEHTVWIGLEYFCNEGDAFWSASEEETVHQAVSELIRMGVLEDETHVLDSHREQVQKAYPAYFDTYDDIGRVIEYLNTFDNLYCVGRNGQHRYNNMDHSMLTAMAAAEAILSGDVRDKSLVWEINTEEEYHEEKQGA